MSLKDLEHFLKFAYEFGIKKITLCGGDPLAREDILELLKIIKTIGFSISLDTLGTPFIKNVALGKNIIKQINIKKISRLIDVVGIPIDGSSNEIINLFRPTSSDIINEQITICKLLKNNKIKVCINTVAHKGNIHDYEGLVNIIKELKGVYKWQIFQFAPLGKYGSKNRKLFEISEREFDLFQKQIISKLSDINQLVEFKKSKDRVKHYMLIDNSGNAWMPEFEKIITNQNIENNSKRLVIGNIKNRNDWEKICKFVKEENKYGE